MLMQCLCNLLCRCFPSRTTAKGQAAADATAPIADKPAEDGQPHSGKRSGNGDGKSP